MASSAFSKRSCSTAGQDGDLPGPDEMRMYVHEVFDTVGLYAVSPLR